MGSLLTVFRQFALFSPNVPHAPGPAVFQPDSEPSQLQDDLLQVIAAAREVQLPCEQNAEITGSIINDRGDSYDESGDDRSDYSGSDDDDGESSQPGDNYLYGSHLTSATTPEPPSPFRSSLSSLKGKTVGPKADELGHVGSNFDDIPSSNDLSADGSDYLTASNLVGSRESRLVKDVPPIPYSMPQHSKSDVSHGWAVEDTQSISNLTRSATVFQLGSKTNLQAQLLASRKGDRFNGLFFPCSVFSDSVTIDCVRWELKETFPDADEEIISELAHQIHEKTEVSEPDPGGGSEKKTKIRCFKRLFVILVMLDKTAAIKDFVANGVDDSDLPLALVKRQHGGTLYDICHRIEPNLPIRFITDHWGPVTIENFGNMQWTTIAPFFAKRKARKSVWHYKLSKEAILPFVSKDADTPGSSLEQKHSGGSADISRVFIHPDHHSFGKPERFADGFALKRLRSPSRDAFKSEVEILKKFSGNRCKYLISLLLTYEQNDEFYLLFKWAECNLKIYWEKVQPCPSATDPETVRWVGRQCRGIARGIVSLHQYQTTCDKTDLQQKVIFGHHGDIKEENILWFPETDELPPRSPNRGVLQLADFGVARFSENHTGELAASASITATPSYRAPESDLYRAQGRSYDIWTLGILYLQMVTWMLGGWALLREFEEMRKGYDPGWHNIETDTFFELGPTAEASYKRSHIIKPAVTEFINELHRNPTCTKFLHEFLKLVAEQMLIIVEEPKQMRIEAMELYAKLNQMVKKCEDEPVYALDANPWTPDHVPTAPA